MVSEDGGLSLYNSRRFPSKYRFQQSEYLIVTLLTILKWLFTLWKINVNHRQIDLLRTLRLPPDEISAYYTGSKFDSCRRHSIKTLQASCIGHLYDASIATVFYAFFGCYQCWHLVIHSTKDPYWQAVGFAFLLITAFHLASFPKRLMITRMNLAGNQRDLSWLRGCTWYCLKTYLVDLVRKLPCAVILGMTLTVGQAMGSLMVTSFFSTVALHYLYSRMVKLQRPLELPQGELKQGILMLARIVKFPPGNILFLDGNEEAEYVADMTSGVLVLGQALRGYYLESLGGGHAKTFEESEVLAILAHQLGHWHFAHKPRRALLQQVRILIKLIAVVFIMRLPGLYKNFGFGAQPPSMIVGFFLSYFCFLESFDELFRLLTLAEMRDQEYAADDFAKALGKSEALISALIKMNVSSQLCPVYDHVFATWNLSRPPLVERILALSHRYGYPQTLM